MERVEIEKLLEQYFEGKTSLEEEKTLRAYFSSDKVAPGLEPYKAMFGFYKNENNKTTNVNLSFDKKPTAWAAYKWSGVAIVLIILAGVAVFKFNTPSVQQQNNLDHQMAVKQTQDLLYMLTDAISTGQEQIDYLNEFSKTKNKILK